MPWRKRMAALLLVMPLLAAGGGDEAGDDLERNARLLRKWKADPEHYARLQQDLQAFRALPPERQQQLRRFDLELHSLDPQTQRHLWDVLERYSLWYERLPEETRKKIEETTDLDERVELIREIKEQQWMERLPQKTRETLADDLRKAKPGEKNSILTRYKTEERERRLKWRKQFESKPAGK